MKTLKLTSKDFKKSDSYWSDYIGKENLSDYDGNVEIAESLGYVRFDSINVKGYLLAGTGSGIEAGSGIKAGEGIKAGWGIKAGEGIKAGWGIKAGEGIEAGEGIKAGWGIKAGEGIEAGWGIVSGLSITCKLVLSFKYRLFAGVAWYRSIDNEDKKVICGKLEGGTVCYGDVEETGLPEEAVKTEEPAEESFTIDGVRYVVTDDLRKALKAIMETK